MDALEEKEIATDYGYEGEQDFIADDAYDNYRLEEQLLYLSKSSYQQELNSLQLKTGGFGLALTLYNEPGASLRASLSALANNFEFFTKHIGSNCDGDINLCIIADGLEKMSVQTKEIFSELGLVLPQTRSFDGDLLFFKRTLDISDIRQSAHIQATSEEQCAWLDIYRESLKVRPKDKLSTQLNRSANAPVCNSDASREYLDSHGAYEPKIQLMLCVKKENSGKLDSHWWYYNVLCRHIEPELCFQMDVGTCPEREAIFRVWQAFAGDPSMGASATRISTPNPKSQWDFLKAWQHWSFCNDVLLNWPGESASGYVSVIPGQFSAIRWLAIKGQSKENQEGKQALDIYFKGLGDLAPHESTLYLAEDRVLGSEIVTDVNSAWKVRQVDTAVAITDPCHSWSELLRQRRRWCAGTFASRVNFLTKLPALMSNEKAQEQHKRSMAWAGVYQSIRGFFEWFIPALLLLSYIDLSVSAQNIVTPSSAASHFFNALSWLNFSFIAAQFAVSLRGVLDRLTMFFLLGAGVIQIMFIASMTILHVSQGEAWPSMLLVAIFCLATPLAARMNAKVSNLSVFDKNIQFAILRPVISLTLWMYAVCNCHDNSWGTKGLDNPDYGLSQKSKYMWYRFRYVFLWLASNALFALLLNSFASMVGVSAVFVVLALLVLNVLFSLYSSRESSKNVVTDKK